MVSTRKRNLNEQLAAEAGTAAHKSSTSSTKQQQKPVAKKTTPAVDKKRRKAVDNSSPAGEAQPNDREQAAAAAAVGLISKAKAQDAAATALDSSADLLPQELIQQLSQARKSKQQQPQSRFQQQQHQLEQHPQLLQQMQHHQQTKRKQKQRLVEVRKGPVRVAVLPAVAAAAEAGTALSAGAAVRRQLLESRIQRSKVMLQ